MAASAGGTSLLAVTARAVVFLAFWLILAGVQTADVPAAVAAVVAAAWVSLRLMPPGTLHVSPSGIVRLAVRFPLQAVLAGIDVARRALAPRMPLRPGFTTCPLHQPPGPACEAFLMYASLLPGTIPCDVVDGATVLVHGVDVAQPIAEQMAREEACFTQAVHGAVRDG